MNLQHLMDQYLQSPLVQQLVNRLSYADSTKTYLKNLQGSSAETIVSAIFMHPDAQALNHLVILNDAEEAAYFHNTIENLTLSLIHI